MPQVASTPVVSSYTEWDPLEEVIVGRADNACVPRWHPVLQATMPRQHWDFFRHNGGQLFPADTRAAAERELDGFCRELEAQGVVVRRPDPVDWRATFSTPDFEAETGLYGAMPRDALLIVGDEIIEAPMAWRSRYFESRAYRPLIKHYFAQGARWTAAPKPQLGEAAYSPCDDGEYDVQAGRSVVTEFEPLFDAADFSRCGRDIFCQVTQVTNRFGIEWLRRHLGPAYTIHILEVDDPQAMHIDASFVPLAPGRVLLHPTRVPRLPAMFDDWEILTPPAPTVPSSHPFYFSSSWLSLNLLSLDETRVFVEAAEKPMIDFLRRHGFEPIPIPFRHFGSLGGAFHCATCDVRRRGTLQSYFR
ncbi:MAG: amidinotransferase [bacterium]|nr:amidinotransferase [Myxococcales bacterium]MCB9543867.1 amidinotransferase [Myxococcales bacterium]